MKELIPVEHISRRIHLIRGHKIMLDSDLAEMYEINARQLKRQVRRNLDRFPSDFMFVLSRREYRILRCQFGTLRWGGHSKYLPFAFTEHGVAMLSSVLNSKRAIQVNIAIVRAFMKLREVLATHKELVHRLEDIERTLASHGTLHKRHAEEVRAVFAAIRELMAPPTKRPHRIGFKA